MKKNRPLQLAIVLGIGAVLSFGQGTQGDGGGGTARKASTIFVGTNGVSVTSAGNTVTIDGSGASAAAGNVFKASNNVFTATNTFNGPVTNSAGINLTGGNLTGSGSNVVTNFANIAATIFHGDGTALTLPIFKSWGTGGSRTFVSNDALTFVQGTVENGKTLTINSVNVTTTNWTAPTTTKVLIYDNTAATTVLQVGTNWIGTVTIASGHDWYGQIINPSNTTEVVTGSIHGKIN